VLYPNKKKKKEIVAVRQLGGTLLTIRPFFGGRRKEASVYLMSRAKKGEKEKKKKNTNGKREKKEKQKYHPPTLRCNSGRPLTFLWKRGVDLSIFSYFSFAAAGKGKLVLSSIGSLPLEPGYERRRAILASFLFLRREGKGGKRRGSEWRYISSCGDIRRGGDSFFFFLSATGGGKEEKS